MFLRILTAHLGRALFTTSQWKIYSAHGRFSVQRVKRNELYKYVIYAFFLFIIYLLAEICKAFMLVHVRVILEIAMDMK